MIVLSYTEDQILTIGGTLDTPAHERTRRVHITRWYELIGLTLEHYPTGNISRAALDGALLSNNQARRLIRAHVYLERGKIRTNLRVTADNADLDGEAFERRLHAAIAAAVAALPQSRPTRRSATPSRNTPAT